MLIRNFLELRSDRPEDQPLAVAGMIIDHLLTIQPPDLLIQVDIEAVHLKALVAFLRMVDGQTKLGAGSPESVAEKAQVKTGVVFQN